MSAPKSSEPKRIGISPTAFVLALSLVALGLLGLSLAFRGPSPPQAAVVISEFCAHNGNGLRDEDGDHSDWIELLNCGREPVNLDGWYLTDNFKDLKRWRMPAVELAPGAYLVVFADAKDRANAAAPLHTNFKLNEKGEYLALVMPDGATVAHDYLPKYPRQILNVSFGLTPQALRGQAAMREAPQGHRYFQQPSPGSANHGELIALVRDVRFSHPSRYCESPIRLHLFTPTPRATIVYTLDGSAPSPTNGFRFAGTIPISTTTVVRAMAFAPGMAASEVDSRTYIFPAGVLKQTGSNQPPTWGTQDDWIAPAHYGMSPEIVNDPAYRDRLKRGLLAIPTLSIITDPRNLFDPERGIYTNPMTNGVAWERPASMEIMFPETETSVRINCGLRIQGGWNRRPMESPKHSLRLMFKKDYGPAKLSYPLFGTNGTMTFNTLILRGGNNNSWLHWSGEERKRGDYLRDEWMRRSFLAMGHPSARGRFVHVYLNGLYWGVYNLCERPDATFVAANAGGTRSDYDAMNAGKMLSGDKAAWNRLIAAANAGLKSRTAYETFQELVDLPDLTDYLILNFFGGNGDWDHESNWYAARLRGPGGRYQFFPWDGERALEGVEVNSMGFDDDQSPPRLFHRLAENPEFRVFFGDRVQRLMFGVGPLSPAPARNRYAALVDEIADPIVAESARWGCYRRDLHQYKVGPFEFYKPDEHWRPEVNRLLSNYFGPRAETVLKQFRERGLYPAVEAPTGSMKNGALELSVPTGAIYYTANGIDPRLSGGGLSSQAVRYSEPIPVSPAQKIKARVATGWNESLQWSALVEF